MCTFSIHQEQCVRCLGCMQSCPVSAISFRGEEIFIDPDCCIDCGLCCRACPHGAIYAPSQIERVKRFIAARRKVILSLSPACRGLLPEGVTLEKLAAAAQKLGVWDVADASEASAAVASEYGRLLREKPVDNLILTFCPMVRNLVEQYYPDLISLLAPVASPMIAHGRMLKRDFTSAAVVAVTTCHGAAEEIKDVRHSTEVNAVLTVTELLDWLNREGITFDDEEEPLLSDGGGVGALCGFDGGMTRALRYFVPEYSGRFLSVSGIRQVMGVLEELRSGTLHGCVLELSVCPGGCVGADPNAPQTTAKLRMEDWVAQEGIDPYFDIQGIPLSNPAISRTAPEKEPTEAEIVQMLYHIGVGNPRQQQNCGACGYETCRKRAEAILKHRENVSLCRRVVFEARRDVLRELFDKLPMAAILVDENQKVVDLNAEACSLFSIRPEQEKYIFELMDPGEFQYVLDTGLPIRSRRMDIPEIYMRVEADLVPLKELNMVLGLFRDITEEEETEALLQSERLQSVEMAQKVIEKQMTVAQQIAFLLGETTAETKVTLNQLKQRILGEEQMP